MHRHTQAALFTALLATLGAATATTPVKGFITGTVVNEQGAPIPGVEIDVDNTLSYDSGLVTYTDAKGQYRVDVRKLPFTFQVYAKLNVKYEGQTTTVELVPLTPKAVPGVTGGVRDFVLRPKPVTPQDPYGNLGCVFIERAIGEYDIDESQVLVTLTPVGKLADGSAGKPRTVRLLRSASGPVIPNVMWGRYTVTATYQGQPLELRRRTSPNTSPWATTYTGGFVREYNVTRLNMYVEMRLPGKDD